MFGEHLLSLAPGPVLTPATLLQRLAVTAVFLANGFGIGAWAASIPAIKLRFDLSDGSLSLILLAFALGAVAAMPVAGWLTPRIGAGQTTRAAGVAFSATLALHFLAPDTASLAAATFIAGAANGIMDVSMNAHAARVETRWGGAIMSSFHAAFSAGGLLGAAIASLLASMAVRPELLLQTAAVTGTALTLACWRAIGRGEIIAAGAALALPARSALPLCAAVLLCFMCEGAVGDWSGVYLASVAGAGPAEAAIGYGAYSAMMFLGRLTGDWLVNRLGGAAIVGNGGILAAIGMVLAVALPAPVPAALGFAMVGLGLANIVPVVFGAAGRIGGGAGIAMAATAGYGGFLGGPPLIGAVASLFGLRAAIALLAAAAAAITLAAGFVRQAAPAPAREQP